jgi:pimeloyl-ACP methyl ester carboxylesterase
MKKKWLLVLPLALFIIYLLGPSPARPYYNKELPYVPAGADSLEGFIRAGEAQHKLKPDNEARIIWANDSSRQKTEYAIVYLHGFSASQAEGDPVHRHVAGMFGCNLYLSRLAEHGIDTVDAMINLTAEEYWESAKLALAIGRQLGKKLILMSTSTGGTLSLQLAAAYPADVDALILLSPNIEINDPNAWLLNNHWGLQIARMVLGSDYVDSKGDPQDYKQYKYTHYRAEAAAALEELLETSMNKELFQQVKQPTLLLYYYKDAVHQDSTVKVSSMLNMFDELGTPSLLKYKQAMPNAGNHVIGSHFKSHDIKGVEIEIEKFMSGILGMKARENLPFTYNRSPQQIHRVFHSPRLFHISGLIPDKQPPLLSSLHH